MLRNIVGPLFNFENCVFVFVFLGLFFKNPLLSAGRTRFSKTKKLKKWTTFKLLKGQKLDQYIYIYIYIYHSLSLYTARFCDSSWDTAGFARGKVIAEHQSRKRRDPMSLSRSSWRWGCSQEECSTIFHLAAFRLHAGSSTVLKRLFR